MIVAIFFNSNKNASQRMAIDIRNFLSSLDVEIVSDDQYASTINALPLSSIDPHTIDFMISIGGDGTILRIFHHYTQIQAPLLGVNLGGLGFMADVPITDIYASLQDLINGAYQIQNRLVIEWSGPRNERSLAVNDVVVHRAQNPSLIDLAIFVDDSYLNTFSADGIILATPSGSTAYSLAAGGPIITPEIDAIVLTPISPHTISNRPIVLMPKKEIRIQYLSEYDPVEITFDGLESFKMSTGNILRLRVSDKKFRTVSLNRHNYFSTLRTKLGWTGKLRV